MSDHKSWLTSIPAARRTKLTQRRNEPGLIHFALHAGATLIVGTLIAIKVPLWPLLLLPQAVLLICFFHLAHEATHATPFRTPILNRIAGHLSGLILVLPFLWFTAFHMAHHRWTNIPGKDPELANPKPTTPLGWLWFLCGVPIWRSSFKVLFRLATGKERPAFLTENTRPKAQREARIMLCVYALALASLLLTPILFWVWIVPLMIGQPMLRCYLLAEHGDLPSVSNMFDNTRTTLTNRCVRWLTWNMPYHTEHHVWPNVPFYNLPEVHHEMRAALKATAPGYIAFTQDYLGRRLQPVRAQATPEQQIRKDPP